MVSRDRDYDIRARRRGSDEVGELIDGFNEMLSEIQRRDQQLLISRTTSSATVDARTAELQHDQRRADRRRATRRWRRAAPRASSWPT